VRFGEFTMVVETSTRSSNWFSFESLDRIRLFSRILFAFIILIYLLITTITVVDAIRWVNKPFPGFMINARLVFADYGQYHWPGLQAGLRYQDRLISADGKNIAADEDLEPIVQSFRVGTEVTYVFDRKGRRFEVTLPTMRFSVWDLLMTYGIELVAGLLYLIIGAAVFIMKPDSELSWVFFLGCCWLGIYLIVSFDMMATHRFIWVYYLGTAFQPASVVHLSLIFPYRWGFVKKYPSLVYIPHLISAVAFVPFYVFYPGPVFFAIYTFFYIYFFLSTISPAISGIFALIKGASTLAKQRAKVVLFGAAVAFPIPALMYVVPLLGGSWGGYKIPANFVVVGLMVYPFCLAYAIARHNLFDVDVYIKRAVGYATMTAIIVGGYLGISIPLNVLVGKYQIAQSRAFPILFTLVVILIFNPLYSRVQAFVDRIFFRKEYDYGKIIDAISGAMTSLLDLGQILNRMVQTFMEDMFIDTSSVVLLTSAGTEYQVTLADGERKQDVEKIVLNRDDPLMEIIEERKKELTKYDVLEDPKFRSVSESCAANFEALNASLMVPLIYQDKVIGILSLGQKKSGKFYNRQDIDLLNAIANQSAVAIENARMVEEVIEKERMEEELSIARDLQVSMLPADCPQIEGFEIAAFSVSAREVGGDFYDFIEMDKEKVGFVIGDVTGKSVSGALVMSASRSVFRMLSEDELTVGESMIRANRRLKKDVKTGMFVALLYAVLNAQDRSLILCSAGQTQPVHIAAQNDRATLIETEGDTFPLGILDDADYEETRIQLEAGDKVVFYTDGIVEAMNEEEEMFGFDRLLEMVQSSKSNTADDLLNEIVNKVKDFTGSAPQHDDLTVIVVSVEG
jgi:sigma-B regulation protein RsbU (phosphoserine phosphatase)